MLFPISEYPKYICMKPPKENPVLWNINGYQLQINHPNKLYWPEDKISKLALLTYYKEMAATLLPYFKNRPVTLHYFPRGIHNFSFYRRNFDQKTNSPIQTVDYQEVSQDKTIQLPLIHTEEGLLWLVSKGCIEFHLWSAKAIDFLHPDMAIFDLDIGNNTPFNKVLKAALVTRDYLKKQGIVVYPKTTGGTGIHLYVPIKPIYDFKTVRMWVKSVGGRLSKMYPELVTTEKSGRKTHQGNRVTIDYSQNSIGRNTAAPYTVRAYRLAPVSTPLHWYEVEKGGFKPTDFNLKNLPARIAKEGDLFEGTLKNQQQLPVE